MCGESPDGGGETKIDQFLFRKYGEIRFCSRSRNQPVIGLLKWLWSGVDIGIMLAMCTKEEHNCKHVNDFISYSC